MINATSHKSEGVVQAIRQASVATGADFNYLLDTAKREASLNPTAKAKTSSASGLFQFIDQTWLGALKNHGESLGLKGVADKIGYNNGRYNVASADKQSVLDLRFDPKISALIAGAHTRDNAEALKDVLARPPQAGELYIAHFMGKTGASKFLQAEKANGHDVAAAGFPKAAEANKAIFYDKSGKARTLTEVKNVLMAKHQTSPQSQDSTLTGADKVSPSVTTTFEKQDGSVSHTLLSNDLSLALVSESLSGINRAAMEVLSEKRSEAKIMPSIDVMGWFDEAKESSKNARDISTQSTQDVLMKSFGNVQGALIAR